MKSYIDYILRKEKKAISLEKLILKIENIISKERGKTISLTDAEKKEKKRKVLCG